MHVATGMKDWNDDFEFIVIRMQTAFSVVLIWVTIVSPDKKCYLITAYLWVWQSSNPVQYSTPVVHSTVLFQKSSPPSSYTRSLLV